MNDPLERHAPTESFRVRATRDVLLVRHGETDWNRQWRLQSTEEVPLNETGREQMRHVGRAVAAALGEAVDASALPSIWSSPVLRAVQSAETLVEAMCAAGVPEPAPLRTHHDLREFEMGRFTGHTIMSLQDDPDWQAYLADPANASFPDGEAVRDIRARAVAAVQHILDHDDADTVIIVSHGGIVRLLVLELLGIPDRNFQRFQIANASISRVRLMPPNGVRVLGINVTPALQPFFRVR